MQDMKGLSLTSEDSIDNDITTTHSEITTFKKEDTAEESNLAMQSTLKLVMQSEPTRKQVNTKGHCHQLQDGLATGLDRGVTASNLRTTRPSCSIPSQ